MTQPTTKAQSALDWLCWVLIVFGGLCLVASIPQTFTMVRVAHDEFGSAILVVVLEVMAFFALLAPLWVPAWSKTFDRIAYVLLGITTLGNYAGGWNYVWTHNEVGPFWMSIRDWREPIFSLPLATILLVGTLSGLVPFAMKFFISLAIKRYRENELDRSPDAVAQRAIEPVLVQIIATRRLQEQLMGLTAQFNNQPLVLPNTQPTVKAQTALADLGIDYDTEMERILAERAAERQEGEQRLPFEPLGGLSDAEVKAIWQEVTQANREASVAALEEMTALGQEIGDHNTQPTVEASDEDEFPWDQGDEEEDREPTLAEVEAKLAAEGWESLTWGEFGMLPASPEKEAERVRRVEGMKQTGLKFLRDVGLLKPVEDEPAVEIAPEVGPAPADRQPAPEPTSASAGAVVAWECDGCGAEGTNGSKGKASKWSKDRGLDKLYCKTCRDSGRYNQ